MPNTGKKVPNTALTQIVGIRPYVFGEPHIQGSPVISAMLNSSTPFIVQNWPGMERIELSLSKFAWIIVLKSPDYCSI